MKKFVVAAMVLAILFSISFYLFTRHVEAQETFVPQRFAGQTLIIDAGHGGEDGGAVSVSGVSESTINLAIARRLDAIMGLYGVNTVMLRMEDVSLHDKDAGTLRQRKVSDLHNRTEIVNQTENGILISIHQNSYTNPKYDGAQVFYASAGESQPFAEYTQEVLRVSLDPENTRMAKEIPDSVYLMNHINCSAILVECGFVTNPEEDLLLQTPEYQLKLAVALAGAYMQYQQIGSSGASVSF